MLKKLPIREVGLGPYSSRSNYTKVKVEDATAMIAPYWIPQK